MVHIVIGVVAIVTGVWWASADLVILCEVLKTLAYLGLVGFGMVAALAGIRQLRSGK